MVFQEPWSLNSPTFTGKLFQRFCVVRNIDLMHSPPYHPARNGLAKRTVETIKKVLNKIFLTNGNQCNERLVHTWSQYIVSELRNTITGQSTGNKILNYLQKQIQYSKKYPKSETNTFPVNKTS